LWTTPLIRQYFPKGSNLALHTPQRVAQVMAELNHRPRKSLGYDTSTQRFERQLKMTAPI
jgi:IS30 family transposase